VPGRAELDGVRDNRGSPDGGCAMHLGTVACIVPLERSGINSIEGMIGDMMTGK
jgi:hypothetical protein